MSPLALRRIGIGLTVLVGLFLAMDAGGKLFAPAMMIANSPPLGLPADEGFHRMLGAILAGSLALYLWPRTALLGAVLLTGFLGGAVAAHARIGSPLLSHTLFGVYLGIIVWAALWCRLPALRAHFPSRQGD
ncbi:MAG: DoxX family protein [Novosphingobium sp.]